MSSRAAEFASAILIGVLAGVFAGAYLITMPYGAADDCLTEPKGDAAQGQHWYYRIDRSTKRHCWYLKGQGEKLARAASPERSTSEKTAFRRPDAAPPQHAVAEAHAELRSRARIEDDTSAATAPAAQAPVVANAAAAPANSAVANDNSAGSNIMSRWPEPTGVSSSVSAAPESSPLVVADSTQPDPAPAPMTAAPMTASQMAAAPIMTAPMMTAPVTTAPTTAAPVAAAPVTAAPPTDVAAPAPATASTSIGKYSGSLQELLVVAFAALALAGLTGSAVYRLARIRHAKRRYDASRRSVDWQPPKKKSKKVRPVDPRPVNMRAESIVPNRDFSPRPRPTVVVSQPSVAPLSEYAPKPRPSAPTREVEDNFDTIEELLIRLAK